jgi:hypothetical protein
MCPSTGLRMVPFKKQPVQPCNDILSEDDCADGKLHCRPTLSKKQPAPIDAAALIEDVFANLKKCSSRSFLCWRRTLTLLTTLFWSA